MECHPVQLSYPFLFTITIFHFPLETKSPLETWISILDTLTTYNLCEKNVFCDSLCLGPLGLSSNESVWVGAIKIPLGFKNHYDLCWFSQQDCNMSTPLSTIFSITMHLEQFHKLIL